MSKRENFVVISHRNFITSRDEKEGDIKENKLALISKEYFCLQRKELKTERVHTDRGNCVLMDEN